MPEDAQTADPSTALDQVSDAALGAHDVAKYFEIENARDIAAKTGKALPEVPPASSEKPSADPEPAKPQEKKPKTGEDRKAELAAEIQDLLKTRKQLRDENEADKKHPAPKPEPEAKPEAKPEPKPDKAKAPIEPKLEDFTTFAEYQKADRAYTRELVKFETRETLQADRAEQATQIANRAIEETWKAKVDEAKAEHSDYAEVAFSKDTPISKAMDGFILKSPAGARILYRLGENDSAEGKRIFALDAYDQVEALIAIRQELAKQPKESPPTPKKHSAAPAPATDLGGRTTEPADAEMAALARGDNATYMRLANAREIKARGR